MSGATLIEAENERYAAVLVFVHGLWARPEVWRPAALGFAHRGWRCALLDSDRADPGSASFVGWCAELGREIDALDLPAVVIGHDAGGLAALELARHPRVCASIAVAPLLEGASPLLGFGTRMRGRLGLGHVAPPALEEPYCRVQPDARAPALADLLVPETAQRVGSLRGKATMPGASSNPRLLVGQEEDRAVAVSLVEIVAAGIEADFLRLPGGHWPMLEPQLDSWMSAVHRWLVRRLGPALLLLDGNEDLAEE